MNKDLKIIIDQIETIKNNTDAMYSIIYKCKYNQEVRKLIHQVFGFF